MKLTLDKEQDIVQYLDYLYKHSTLTHKFPSIVLEGTDCDNYLKWLYSQEPDEEDDEPTESVIVTVNSNKRWSTEEDSVLSSLILEGMHPSDIGKAIKRSEDGVRHRARSNLSMAYQNGKWRDYNYSTN